MYLSRVVAYSLVLCLIACADPPGQALVEEAARETNRPDEVESLAFGVVPQQAPSQLARSWIPILDHIGAQLGTKLAFQTAPDIPEFERRLARGDYDIAYMNPYHYITVHDSVGYRAAARAADKRIHGIFVVPRDSPIRDLSELDGRTIAFPSPSAFAASLLPQAHLRARGSTIEPRYVSSHDSVYRTVAEGLYPAGGGVLRTFNATDASVRAQLRVLWTTEGYTPHAIASHPRVPEDVTATLVRALVTMSDSPEKRPLLDALALQGFVAAVDSDWDDIRSLMRGGATSSPAGAREALERPAVEGQPGVSR